MSRHPQDTAPTPSAFPPPENGLTILTQMGPGGRLRWACAAADVSALVPTVTKRRRRLRARVAA